jgi:hypothetical protein
VAVMIRDPRRVQAIPPPVIAGPGSSRRSPNCSLPGRARSVATRPRRMESREPRHRFPERDQTMLRRLLDLRAGLARPLSSGRMAGGRGRMSHRWRAPLLPAQSRSALGRTPRARFRQRRERPPASSVGSNASRESRSRTATLDNDGKASVSVLERLLISGKWTM